MGASVLAGAGVGVASGRETDRERNRDVDPQRGRDLFVDPDAGDDEWGGNQPEPTGRGNGPLRTLDEAFDRAYDRAAELDGSARSEVNVWLRGGHYRRSAPLQVTPHGTDVDVNLRAYEDEEPVVDGGETIEGWEETTVNGVDAWKTTVEDVASGDWYFRQLFVDGERRQRPRLPENGYFSIADASGGFLWNSDENRTFVAEEGDVDEWHNIQDVDVVLPQLWISNRSPIESFDPDTNEVTLELWPQMLMSPPGGRFRRHRYWVENVFEALSDPGEWYLDRDTGELYYVPHEDESMGDVEVVAPRARQLLRVVGDVPNGEFVENLAFEDVSFRNTGWYYPGKLPTGLPIGTTEPHRYHVFPGGAHRLLADGAAASHQAAVRCPAAILLYGAHGCSFEGCTFANLGWYGLELGHGCVDNAVAASEFAGLGAGGVHVSGIPKTSGAVDDAYHEYGLTGRNEVADCHVSGIGRVFHGAVGVLHRESFGNVFAHNHVHDAYYTGLSVGWKPGMAPTNSHHNLVLNNHVHDVMKTGLIDDGGAIYLRAIQEGTLVKGNLFHDVGRPRARGLYLDSSASKITLSENVVYDTGNEAVTVKGLNNTFHNNVLYMSDEMDELIRSINLERVYPDDLDEFDLTREQFSLSRNIIVTSDSTVPIANTIRWSLDEDPFIESDHNLLSTRDGEWGEAEVSPYTLKVVRASDGAEVEGASVDVDPLGGPTGEFVYGELDAPVTLEANTRYYVLTEQERGGPGFYNPLPVTTTDDATVVGQVFEHPQSGAYFTNENGRTFGPVDFRYETGSGGGSSAFVTDATLDTTLRDDFPGFLGMIVEVGDDPIAVTHLGRVVPPFQTWWDAWRAAGLDEHSVVADPEFVDAADPAGADWALASDSPARDPPVEFDPIDVSDVGPRTDPGA
jgi:hypothetical protein